MNVKIVGKQPVDYVSKKTNQPVQGVTLHCVGTNERVNGLATETIFVSGKSPLFDKVMKLPLESDVTVVYNRWGSCEDIVVCK
mgnify:CR=1 FL=1